MVLLVLILWTHFILVFIYFVGVWRDTYPTRRDEIYRLLFFILNDEIYSEK